MTRSAETCVRVLSPVPRPQVVKGSIVQGDKRTVLIDVGYKSMQRFFRSELDGAPIYNEDGTNRGIPTELLVRRSFLFLFAQLLLTV